MIIARITAGVNPVEPLIRSGQFPLLGAPPVILGWDVSGVVEDLEPGVTRFSVGDEVYGMPFFPRAASAYAEYVAAPSRQLARGPACRPHPARHRVLIHSTGGGVGHLAVQIAKARGVYVIGTASAGKHEPVARARRR